MTGIMTISLGRRPVVAAALAACFAASIPPAHAQRDPAYATAKASGEIGEKTDGYVGIVGSGSASLRAVVDDINIKRKAVYAEKAKQQHATIEEYAFTSGCLLIAQTKPGEKYQAPDGSWKTRGGGAPDRDPRCP